MSEVMVPVEVFDSIMFQIHIECWDVAKASAGSNLQEEDTMICEGLADIYSTLRGEF